MNFYNDDDKKGGAPVIPGAASPFKKTSAFGKSPMFSRAAGSVFDRLKNLSRKDMAFVGIGLSVLVMAPVAEYMMSQPAETNLLRANDFNGPRGQGPNDSGLGNLSPGSSDGSGEVITPLSSRDPASLILGSQPAQPVMPPASAPPPQSSWRDAVKDAGREAFSAATKSAGAPTPIPKMQSGMRGLFGGGESTRSSGSLGGGKIIQDAQSASSKAAKRSMVGPVAMAGYKGVASNTPNSASKGAFEKLRSQADKSAGYFTGGSAMNSLDKAAAEAVNVGAGAGGAGGLGDGDKTTKPSNSNNKYEHNRSGETLAEMAAKQRMNKALEWEFFKKYEIPKQIINAVVGKVAEWFGKQVERGLNGPGGAPTTYICALTPPTGDCNNPVRGPRSADPETIKKWDSKTCPCGVYSTDEWPGGAGTTTGTPTGTNTGGGTGNETGTTTGGGTGTETGQGSGNAPAIAQVFKDYDETLKQMLLDIQAGAATSDPKVLLDKSIAVAGGFANLKADRVVIEINNRTDATKSSEVNAYERAIVTAKRDLEAEKSQYRLFKTQLANILAAANNNTLVSGSANGISADTTQAVKPYVQSAMDQMVTFDRDFVAKADAKIAFHERALPVYNSQLGQVKTLAGGVSEDYTGSVLGSANGILGELNTLKTELGSGQPNAEQVTKIKEKFLALSGADSAVATPPAQPVVPSNLPSGLQYVSAPPADLRTAVADFVGRSVNSALNGEALIAKPVTWRGLNKETPFEAKGPNDAEGRSAEAAAWAETSPATKKGVASAVVDLNNLAPASLLGASIRGADEVKKDAGNAAVDPGTAVSLMNPIKEEMEKIRKTLTETWKIDMANPTGGGANTGTGTGSATGTGTGTGSGASTGTGTGSGSGTGAGTGAGVMSASNAGVEALRAMDATIAVDQPLYNEIWAGRRNCTSTTCTSNLRVAGEQMQRMNTLRSEVGALREAAAKPGADVPAIQRQIDEKQAAFNNAHAQFAPAAATVKRLEGIPSHPAAGHNTGHNTGHSTGSGTGTSTGSGTSGIDPQRAAAYRATLQVKNQAIQDARREMDVAVAASNRAKATFDAAFKKCDDRCDGVIGENACWAVCKVETRFEAKNQAFTQANQSANSRIQYVGQKKRDCAAFMSTVPANYRTAVGTCEN
ncbi:MAG: hypothetical protein PHV33_04505 [Elusimicrobiales bacterium]|nr:hypothetical protein [Elusimicrobiales bacterium]